MGERAIAGVDKGEGEVDEVGTNVGRVRGVEGAEVSESKEAWERAGEGRVAEGAQPMGKPWAAKALTKASQPRPRVRICSLSSAFSVSGTGGGCWP